MVSECKQSERKSMNGMVNNFLVKQKNLFAKLLVLHLD